MPVESEIERGARMKSVGILATSYTLLYRHMQFLETQVRYRKHLQFYLSRKKDREGEFARIHQYVHIVVLFVVVFAVFHLVGVVLCKFLHHVEHNLILNVSLIRLISRSSYAFQS